MKDPIFGDPWNNLFYGSLGMQGILYGAGWTFWVGLVCVILGASMAATGWLVKR